MMVRIAKNRAQREARPSQHKTSNQSVRFTDKMSHNTGDLILVTGASGFVAKHTILQALKAGYRVRGTVRDEQEADIVGAAVLSHSPGTTSSCFSLVRADLTSDTGWQDAVKDCTFVLHIAAPYPNMDHPPDGGREALVPVCRDGTLRVLQAALTSPSVQRVIMVSSIVSVIYWPGRPKPVTHFKETDWSDPDWKDNSWAYAIAKTRAEMAAWEFARALDVEHKLVSVNPGMVWGPLLDSVECTSSDMCKMFLKGAYPFCIPLSFPIVDVRDVAALLVASMKAPGVGGRRLFAAAPDMMELVDISKYLAVSFPKYASKLPTWVAPKWLVHILALFDAKLKRLIPDMETRLDYNAAYVTELTGVKFRPSREAVYAMADSMVQRNLV